VSDRVIPKCKYHIDQLLESIEDPSPEQDRKIVALQGIKKYPDGKAEIANWGFLVKVYRCPICGYVEMFDSEAS